MTWYSTWPVNNIPAYKAHDTEQQAEQHATSIVASGIARVATYYEIDTTELSA